MKSSIFNDLAKLIDKLRINIRNKQKAGVYAKPDDSHVGVSGGLCGCLLDYFWGIKEPLKEIYKKTKTILPGFLKIKPALTVTKIKHTSHFSILVFPSLPEFLLNIQHGLP